MPRTARIVIPGIAHHITQQGNNRQDVFFVDDDRIKFLELVRIQSRKFGVIIDGFCLMSNHIHLIARPKKSDSLAKMMGRVNLIYSQYISYLHGRSGHLWQNRYYSCPLDTNHFYMAMRYIEQNPVRAKMIEYPWKYDWSSAGFHIGQQDRFELLDKKSWQDQSEGLDWKKILQAKLEKKDLEKVRNYCRTGRPLGTDTFLSKLETALGRRLRAFPVGRPKTLNSKKQGKRP